MRPALSLPKEERATGEQIGVFVKGDAGTLLTSWLSTSAVIFQKNTFSFYNTTTKKKENVFFILSATYLLKCLEAFSFITTHSCVPGS